MYQVDVSRLTYFVVYEFKLFAPAQVNARQTLAWLDTAANQATVSPEVAKDLPRTGNIFVRSAFGQEEYETVEVEVEFLGNVKSAVRARIDPTEREFPFPSAVTLGAGTLFAEPVVFDFRLMGMYPPRPGECQTGWVELSAKFTPQELCLVQCVAPGGPLWALFDTGAGLSVMNANRLQALGLELEPAYEIEIEDATGAKRVHTVASCAGVQLGEAPLPPFDCFVANLHGIEDALGYQVDMILGANAMLNSGLKWCIDRRAGSVKVAG